MVTRTPKSGADYDFFATNAFQEGTPRNNRIVEEANMDEQLIAVTPRSAKVPPQTPTARNNLQINTEALSPITNLRKRRPPGLDKIDIKNSPPKPLKSLKSASVVAADRTPKERDAESASGDEFEDDDTKELALEPHKQAMLRLLMKTLYHDKIDNSDLEKLGTVDLEILRSIVKRKYKININVKDLDDRKKLLSILNTLDESQKTEKRSEENNKLVFKRAIKFMINKKKSDNASLKEMKKKEYETTICNDYFSGIPLPQVKKRKQPANEDNSLPSDERLRRFVINPNTINAKYIRFVYSSAAFKTFFEDFLERLFIQDYQRARKAKVLKVIETVYSFLTQKKAKHFQVQSAKDYIEKNAKFKLPWTDKELRECLKSTKEFIGRVFRVRDDKRKRH